jgi:hypothetical protein
MIKFYRGTKAKYQESPSTYTDGIYFTTDSNEILINGGVYGKNADASVTTENVVVAGGPLADAIKNWPTDTAWNSNGNRIIPAGTSMQTLTEKLFLQATPGSVSWSVEWDPTLKEPTVQLMKTDKSDAGSEAEVGTSLIVKTTTNSGINNNTRVATCTASEGYFDTTDGVWNEGNKEVTASGSSTGTLAVEYSWNDAVLSGFESQSTVVKVAKDTNTFKVSQSGITATSSAFASQTVYASDNTKKVVSSVSATLNDTHKTSKVLSSSKSDTITGYYRWSAFAADSIDITKTESSWQFTKSKTVSSVTAADQKYIVVLVPSGFTLKTASQMNLDFTGSFSTKDITLTIGGGSDTHAYKMYYWQNTSGSNATVDNITIS